MTRQPFISCWSIAAMLCSLSLAGCATPEPRIVYRDKLVPIVQPCKPQLSPEPDYPTTQKPVATDIFEQMKTLLAERDLRIARDLEQTAALKGCAGD